MAGTSTGGAPPLPRSRKNSYDTPSRPLTVEENQQSKERCRTAQEGLKKACMVGGKTADCAAGTWMFSSNEDLNGTKSSHASCSTNFPMVSWGEPTCAPYEEDGKVFYSVACDLCFANTSVCAHWWYWASYIIGSVLLCCCCCFCSVCFCCRRRKSQ